MRSYLLLILKEIKDLFFSKTALLLILITCFIVGYSFFTAVSLYSNASISAINNPLYATGFEPVPGVFVPTFGGLFIIFSLFLPFLYISLIGNEKRYNTLTLLLQLSFNLRDIILSKIIAGILFLIFILFLSLPATGLWICWGGHIPWIELSLLMIGYFLYGLLVLSISIFASTIFNNMMSASIFSIVTIIVSWLIDFGKDMNISPFFITISEWTLTKTLKYFEDGIFSFRAFAYFILLSVSFIISSYVFLRLDLKKKWRFILATITFLIVGVFVSSLIHFNKDLTESGRNSFSPDITLALKKIPNIEIDVYLERTDSRFKDYERSFLRKLRLIRNDVKVNLKTGDTLKENYGLFVYKVNNKSAKTFSNSEEEIFPILFQLAGIRVDNSVSGVSYSGYPLVTATAQRTTVLYVYFIFIPLTIIALFLIKHFKKEVKMIKKKISFVVLAVSLMSATPIFAQNFKKFTFEDEVPGAESKVFSSIIGTWHIDKDGDNLVYAVDGRKWEQGLMASGVVEKAKRLYGERYAEFLDNLEAYKYFPLSICKEYPNFENGTLIVKFKAISGRIDQAAGIAFNIKQNGDYLVVRANPMENNMVLFKMEKGKRSPVQWIRNVPTPSLKWHTLKVVISGKRIEGYLNGKKYIDYTHTEEISGKIGLWSKADSYVFFDDFIVQPDQK